MLAFCNFTISEIFLAVGTVQNPLRHRASINHLSFWRETLGRTAGLYITSVLTAMVGRFCSLVAQGKVATLEGRVFLAIRALPRFSVARDGRSWYPGRVPVSIDNRRGNLCEGEIPLTLRAHHNPSWHIGVLTLPDILPAWARH